MREDESEQPLTEHLVDQFASYFLITMVAFHLVGYMKKHYGNVMGTKVVGTKI